MLLLPLLERVLRLLRLLLLLLRLLLLRQLLLLLTLPLLVLLVLLSRQHGWSMLDQSCCCGFSFFLLVHDEMDERPCKNPNSPGGLAKISNSECHCCR